MEEFASHRAQIERLLELADEYDLSGMDRDKLRHAADDKPVAHFDDERARGLADKQMDVGATDLSPIARPSCRACRAGAPRAAKARKAPRWFDAYAVRWIAHYLGGRRADTSRGRGRGDPLDPGWASEWLADP
jgi:hypothetical protein